MTTCLKELAEQVKANHTPEGLETLVYDFEPNRIYHTRGVYASLHHKDNGVKGVHLADHIKYNVVMRFGRALFIEGICFNQGYLSKEECETQAKKLVGVKASKDTQPYH